ncbi:hypothetical protein HN011_006421, partial [Eciton burchellii]
DEGQRGMDMESNARAMLQLLLGRYCPLFAHLPDQSKYKVINEDRWCNIVEFPRTINHNLSDYDLWNVVMLDESNG